MDCSDFLSDFTEYYDGSGDPDLRSRAEGHLESCPSCRRYLEVVERGARILRSLPEVPVPSDFRPRLRHRIYHVADEDALGSSRVSSGVNAVVVVALAVLLGFAAWTPLVGDRVPEVTLSPIVVSEAPPRRPALRLSPASFLGGSSPRLEPAAFRLQGWEGSRSLLFPDSPPAPARAGLLLRAGLD